MIVPEADELPRVMREISEAMSARGAALTTHPSHDGAIRVLYNDAQAGIAGEVLSGLLFALEQTSKHEIVKSHQWLEIDRQGGSYDVLCLPVQAIERHSQLVISVFFDRLTRQQRQDAEAVYLRRRPFAVGYFRLWQLDQTRKRHIAGLEAALGFFEMGVILLDRSARIAFANPAAAALLDTQNGVRSHNGRLVATDIRSSMRLQVAIDHVISEGRQGAVTRRAPLLTLARASGDALVVSVFPAVHPAQEPADVAAILYLIDPTIDADRLLQPICRLHHLSPLETRLVCLLSGGATLGEAAVRMNVKEQTVRGSLKQIFMKTGTHRQADLIRVMLTSIIRTTSSITTEVI